jgi:hypothetical protein
LRVLVHGIGERARQRPDVLLGGDRERTRGRGIGSGPRLANTGTHQTAVDAGRSASLTAAVDADLSSLATGVSRLTTSSRSGRPTGGRCSSLAAATARTGHLTTGGRFSSLAAATARSGHLTTGGRFSSLAAAAGRAGHLATGGRFSSLAAAAGRAGHLATGTSGASNAGAARTTAGTAGARPVDAAMAPLCPARVAAIAGASAARGKKK